MVQALLKFVWHSDLCSILCWTWFWYLSYLIRTCVRNLSHLVQTLFIHLSIICPIFFRPWSNRFSSLFWFVYYFEDLMYTHRKRAYVPFNYNHVQRVWRGKAPGKTCVIRDPCLISMKHVETVICVILHLCLFIYFYVIQHLMPAEPQLGAPAWENERTVVRM